MVRWTTGGGEDIDFDEIVLTIQNYIQKGSKIFIGTDSFVSKRKTCMATAICVHKSRVVGKYFYTREHLSKKTYPNLKMRMLDEVNRTVALAWKLVEMGVDANNIELHLDVAPFDAKTKTSNLSENLKGYALGAGFDCKIKPEAFAASNIADKHSKKRG